MIKREPTDPRFSPISLRKELLGNGVHDREIARSLADGTLVRLRHGAYVSGASWRAADEAARHGLRCRAVLRQAKAELVLSHLSSALEWDVPMWDIDLDLVNATRIDEKPGRRREAGVVQHVGTLRDGDVMLMNGVRLTPPPRTAVDCMTVFDVEHGVTTVNDLLHRELMTLDELDAAIAYMDRWPGTLHHRVVRRLATGKPESVGENRAWHLFWRMGLPMPEPQYEVVNPYGLIVARVDFAWPQHRVFVEFDGRVKYAPETNGDESPTTVVLREKRREERVCELTGWRCVRIIWSDLYHPERTAARIRAAMTPATGVG